MVDYSYRREPYRAEDEVGEYSSATMPSPGFYLVAGVIVAIVLAGSLLFMNSPPADRGDIALQPGQLQGQGFGDPANGTRTPAIPPRPLE